MIANDLLDAPIAQIAQAVRTSRVSAEKLALCALDRIERKNPSINTVTRVLRERALVEARNVDAIVARGEDPGPLAGVPYGVKDLFDVKGLSTTAGAGRLRDAPPATCDAQAISRLQAAGAVLVATLNMDEFAYGFVTDNAHWGLTRNPWDTERFAGGSSGGSAAAVAAGTLPFTLGSDTNGSIRIPASLCGIYGTKPSHHSLPMEGVYPFVHSLDDIGAFARSAADLAMVDAVLRGEVSCRKATGYNPSLALLGGWFAQNLSQAMRDALAVFAQGQGGLRTVELDGVDRARSAAFLITAYEGGMVHREALLRDPLSYDPATRDRLIAGAALPEAVYQRALDYRAAFAAQMAAIHARYDVLIAPATYGSAPRIDDPTIPIDGQKQPARANLGLYTQPISYIGLPVVAAPLPVAGLPMGIQLIGAPGKDALVLDVAQDLQQRGLLA